MKKLNNFISRFYLVLVFIFLYAPIATLIVFSFNDSKSMSHWSGFTFKWYIELLHNESILQALFYTLVIAILSSAVATIIGTISAVGIHNMRGAKKALILNINSIPVLNPDIVTGVSLMALFIFAGTLFNLEMGFFTMLLAHIVFNIPYVILSILPKLSQMPENLVDAAIDLGATPSYAFRKVVLPQIMPGIVAGAIMAFTMSIDDFVISFFTTGPGVSNLSMEIFAMARRGIKPEINALSTIMFVVVLVLLLVVNRKSALIKEE